MSDIENRIEKYFTKEDKALIDSICNRGDRRMSTGYIMLIMSEFYERKANEGQQPEKADLYQRIMPMLRNAHKIMEVEFDELSKEEQNHIVEIREMCKNIADDYWMYERE